MLRQQEGDVGARGVRQHIHWPQPLVVGEAGHVGRDPVGAVGDGVAVGRGGAGAAEFRHNELALQGRRERPRSPRYAASRAGPPGMTSSGRPAPNVR